MSPAEIDACTLWEFFAAVDGWTKAHAPDADKPTAMAEDRARELGIEGL